jgi:hypothetical protein
VIPLATSATMLREEKRERTRMCAARLGRKRVGEKRRGRQF